MASISANGSKGNHKFTLTVTETSTDKAKNSSSVQFSFELSPVVASWAWSQWGNDLTYEVIVNGQSYTGNLPDYDGYSTVTVRSDTQEIPHNEDGTKTINFSFSVTDVARKWDEENEKWFYPTYTPGNASASGTLKLTDIERTYTVHFDGNGATGGNTDDAVMTYGVESALPVNGFVRENYTFAGWSSFPVCTAIYGDGEFVKNLSRSSPVTLYAVWEHNLFKKQRAQIGSKRYKPVVFDGNSWVNMRAALSAQTNETDDYFVLDESCLDEAVLG